jgi:hypothetical protein
MTYYWRRKLNSQPVSAQSSGFEYVNLLQMDVRKAFRTVFLCDLSTCKKGQRQQLQGFWGAGCNKRRRQCWGLRHDVFAHGLRHLNEPSSCLFRLFFKSRLAHDGSGNYITFINIAEPLFHCVVFELQTQLRILTWRWKLFHDDQLETLYSSALLTD